MASNKHDYQPLRVRAYLRTGVVSDAFLPLDAILLYQAHREKEGAQAATYPGKYSSRGGVALPLDTVSFANRDFSKWYQYYRCSWAQWPQHTTQASEHWNKRFDNHLSDWVDFGSRRGSVNVVKSE